MGSPGNKARNRDEAFVRRGEQFRWKKGQSGNPNGRPKRKTLRALLKEADPLVVKELIRCMQSEDIEQALQAILLYARFRHAEEWRAGGAQAAGGPVVSKGGYVEPDITAEQRRAVIRYLAEQLTPKEVPHGPTRPEIASGRVAESARGQPAAREAFPQLRDTAQTV